MGRSLLSRLLDLAHVGVKITGGKRDLVMTAGDLLYRRLPQGGDRTLHIEGHSILIDPAQPAERLLFYAQGAVMRHYEGSPLFSCMRRHIRKGDTFVDVGANLGIYSMLARWRLGARTVVFEPEAAHLAFLERNGAHFDEIHSTALGEKAGSATFYVSGERNPGASSLVATGDGEEAYERATEVAVRRFDEVLSGREDVAFVKIDVEGAEAAVVCGMEGYLSAGARPAIWCEVRGPASDRNPDSWREVADFLSRFGYRAFTERIDEPFDPSGAPLAQVFDLFFCAD